MNLSRLFIILIFIFSTSYSFGQDAFEFEKINKSDSNALKKVMDGFIQAIEKKNSKKIKSLSLSKIDCDICINYDPKKGPPDDYIIPVDTFILQAFENFKGTPLLESFRKGRLSFSHRIIKDLKPRNLPDHNGSDLHLFEVWIQTYLPNEWVKGHEGQSHAFQFVKINNKFKFYGITSIP